MSTELAGRASWILTSSDLTYYEALSRGVQRLATAGPSPSTPRLSIVSARPVPPQPSVQASPPDSAYLLGPCRYRLSRTSGEGRG